MNRYIMPTNPTNYPHQSQAHLHQQHANMHRSHANALMQQAQAHHQYAEMHQHHANLHQQQENARFYQTQPITTANNPMSIPASSYGYGPSVSFMTAPQRTGAGNTDQIPSVQTAYGAGQQPVYDEKHTAYNNQVSPAALVFHGRVSPEAMASLQQYQNPYTSGAAYPNYNVSLAPHAAHATENETALQRGHKF